MIQVKNLSKIYKQGELEVKAVNNISMKVYDGEFTAVVGPSGSGKTTLALLLLKPLKKKYHCLHIDGDEFRKKKRNKLILSKKNIINNFINFMFPIYDKNNSYEKNHL